MAGMGRGEAHRAGARRPEARRAGAQRTVAHRAPARRVAERPVGVDRARAAAPRSAGAPRSAAARAWAAAPAQREPPQGATEDERARAARAATRPAAWRVARPAAPAEDRVA